MTEPSRPILDRAYVASAPRTPAAIDSQFWDIIDDSNPTPSVANKKFIKLQTTIPDFTFTYFKDGQDGQELYILGDDNAKIANDPNFILIIGPEDPVSAKYPAQFVFKDGVWHEVAPDLLVLVSSTGAVDQDVGPVVFNLVAGVPQQIVVSTQFATSFPVRWESPSDATLKFISPSDRIAIDFLSFTIEPAGSNQTFLIEFLRNGIPFRTTDFTTGNPNRPYAISLSGMSILTQNDLITAQITAVSSVTIEINNFTISVMDFFLSI